jgi:hypothetical protein
MQSAEWAFDLVNNLISLSRKAARSSKEAVMSQPNGPEQLSQPVLVMQMITGHWVSQLVGSLCRLGVCCSASRDTASSARPRATKHWST